MKSNIKVRTREKAHILTNKILTAKIIYQLAYNKSTPNNKCIYVPLTAVGNNSKKNQTLMFT